jgi:hypothetical protein
VLDEAAHEALHRAEQRPVNHHRPVALAVLADVVDVEPLWQVEIELNRGPGPFAAKCIDPLDVNLGAVEGATALIDLVGEAALLHRPFQVADGAAPDLVVADRFFGPGRQVRLELVAEHVRHVDDEVDHTLDLADDLLRRAEDV